MLRCNASLSCRHVLVSSRCFHFKNLIDRQSYPVIVNAIHHYQNLCTRRHFVRSKSSRQTDEESTRRILEQYKQRERGAQRALLIGTTGFVFFLAYLIYEYVLKQPNVDTVESIVVQAMIADKEGRPVDAERIYHRALVKAQQNDFTEGIIYIYDQMANLAMKRGHYHKAEELFKESLRGLLGAGFSKDDNAVIEMSLKLAEIYAKRHRHVEASAGFVWCIETTDNKIAAAIENEEADMNTLSLLGLCWNAYASYLLSQKRLVESEKAFLKALYLCEKQLTVDGMKHPQTVTILNDLGTVYDQQNRFDDAYEYVKKALDLAQQVSKTDIPRLLCNVGSIEMNRKNYSDAEVYFTKAQKIAEKKQDKETMNYIKDSLVLMNSEKLKVAAQK
ncbi:tetratricopeptide repeat protein 19, mitochondrial-like [Glandiceps talaboti]